MEYEIWVDPVEKIGDLAGDINEAGQDAIDKITQEYFDKLDIPITDKKGDLILPPPRERLDE